MGPANRERKRKSRTPREYSERKQRRPNGALVDAGSSSRADIDPRAWVQPTNTGKAKVAVMTSSIQLREGSRARESCH